MDIRGSVAVVTGASSGIGAASARLLHREGAHVVLAARRGERLAALAEELPGTLPCPGDITDAAYRRSVIARSIEAFGAVDILVNNAGQGLHVPVLEIDPEDLRAVFDLNVVAALGLLQEFVRAGEASRTQSVVNVSSATSLRLMPGLGGYSATKAALNLLSQVVAVELAPRVSVSVVYPRLTATEFHDNLRAGAIAPRARASNPDTPDLVAAAILHAIRSGERHLLVADPPLPLRVGEGEWGVALATPPTP